jgi:hypothetical protein
VADQPNPLPIAGRDSPEPVSVPKPAAEDAEQAALDELSSVVAELLAACMHGRARTIR